MGGLTGDCIQTGWDWNHLEGFLTHMSAPISLGGGWSWEDPHSLGTWRGSLISVWPVCGVFPAWLWPDEPDFLCHGTGSNARVLGKSDLGGVSVPRSMAQPPESHSVPSGLLCSLEASFCSSHLGGRAVALSL